jgi:hypothetical protein
MIIRIASEDQYRLDDDVLTRVNELDNAAVAAVEAGDREGFQKNFDALLALVRTEGTVIADDDLETSDVIIPPDDLSFEEAGAEFVGGEYLVKKIEEGFTDFDVAIATPDMMVAVGRLGRVLGPSGKMPNPKTGTVTFDVAKAVTEIQGGKVEYRTDRSGIVHIGLGKRSFTPEQLTENYAVILEEILRVKPAATKGKYIKSISIAQTMGPGVDVDPNITSNLLEEVTA